MKKYFSKIILFAIFSILLLFAITAALEASTIQTNRFHSYLKQGIDKAFNMETAEANALLKKALELEPENPSGYAYLSMFHLFSYEMTYNLEGRKKDQEAIVRYASATLSLGAKRLEINSRDAEAYLAMALAKIAKVHWAIQEKHYLAMAHETSHIWNYLERASQEEPNNFDIYFLMGLLHYHIDHLPGLTRFASSVFITSGDSQKGLREIELAAQKGDLLRAMAQAELQSDYLNFEKQPAQALSVVMKLREKFPNNYNFLFAEANALAELSRFREALPWPKK